MKEWNIKLIKLRDDTDSTPPHSINLKNWTIFYDQNLPIISRVLFLDLIWINSSKSKHWLLKINYSGLFIEKSLNILIICSFAHSSAYPSC